jgi:hypothetical protein
MEQTLVDIRTKVPDFAGYQDEVTRRLADEQIRAIVGEALALTHEKHNDYFDDGEATEIYDRLILRCEFTNQAVFKFFEYEQLSGEQRTAIARADNALIAKALEAQTVSKEQLVEYLHQLEAAFETREKALTNS